MTEYDFIRFEKAKAKNKKYSAIIRNKKTNKLKKLNFGDNRYKHFFDKTGLKIYTHLNHNDKQRRKNYISRHSVFIKKGFYSPSYFSMNFLW